MPRKKGSAGEKSRSTAISRDVSKKRRAGVRVRSPPLSPGLRQPPDSPLALLPNDLVEEASLNHTSMCGADKTEAPVETWGETRAGASLAHQSGRARMTNRREHECEQRLVLAWAEDEPRVQHRAVLTQEWPRLRPCCRADFISGCWGLPQVVPLRGGGSPSEEPQTQEQGESCKCPSIHRWDSSPKTESTFKRSNGPVDYISRV